MGYSLKKMDYSLNKLKKNLNYVKKKLVELEKKIKQTNNNRKRQKLFRDNRKHKIESLNYESRNKVIGKTGEASVGAPKKNDDEAVIASIKDIALL